METEVNIVPIVSVLIIVAFIILGCRAAQKD